MKKRTKIILAAVLVLLLLVAAAAGVGNYFVNFALVRAEEGTEKNVAPEAATTDEVQQTVEENNERIAKHTEEWLSKAEKETASITSEDGLKLVADKYYGDRDSHKWALLIHGYGGNRSGMQNIGAYYLEQGYNLLMPDMRAHGESEGTFIGMGWLDRLDVLQWLNLIVSEDEEAEIVLHGVSMGGATVMMVSGEQLPSQVKAIVEDCGYTSVWDIFSDELDALFHLPSFPLLDLCNLVGRIRAGYDFKEASALEQVQKSTTPMLFIHGSEDNFVHTDMVYELYEAAQCEKELLVVEGAGHGESYNLDPELYFETVFGFLENYI